jgi:hypothetical protein
MPGGIGQVAGTSHAPSGITGERQGASVAPGAVNEDLKSARLIHIYTILSLLIEISTSKMIL